MITGRIYKNKFAADLNSIYYGGESNIGVYFDTIRLHQFLETLQFKIQEDNKAILEGLENEAPETKASIINQIHIDNSLSFFSDILLKSIFIVSYSILEKKLKEICILFNAEYGLQDYAKYRHKATGKCDLMAPKDYLANIANIDISTVESLWKQLFYYKEIRKAIVHHGSEFDNSSIPTIFQNDPNISFENGVITITNEKFNELYLDSIDQFFSDLINSINNQLDLVQIISNK